MRHAIRKSSTLILLIGVAVAAYYFYAQSNKPKPEELYRFQPIKQGSVEQSVSANGTLNPVTVVSVGTQVSGRVSKLYVDFNDKVEKGQVLLELDDSLFTAQIAQSSGTVRNAQASLELAQANESRIRTLYQQEYVSRQELDQAVQSLKSARAQLDTAIAQLRRDQTNLGFSIIRSPVSGIVVDRVIDVGQTVAASFQTPTLIKIAQDLSKMQINSSFAEADIGNIKEGQKARFTVDAFPNRNFEGTVKQLRLNPTINANVVTYDVVISVDNPDLTLLPGMTAYVSIAVAREEDAMLAPNAALRFKPSLQEDEAPAAESKPAFSGNGRAKGKRKSGDISLGKVYVLRDGKPTAVRVRLGISDGQFTKIASKELKAGDKVITGETQVEGASQPQGNMRMRMF
jgi:HlyD family secretion protein